MELRKLLIGLILVCLATQGISQKNKDPLPWVKKQYPPNWKSENYRVIHVEGNTLDESWENAQFKLISELAREKGYVGSKEDTLISENVTVGENDNFSGNKTTRINTLIKVKYNDFQVSHYLVDEYYKYKHGKYQYWGLFEISDNGRPLSLKRIEFINNYGLPPVLLSFLVPGAGQFYKKNPVKGLFLLASQVVLITTTYYWEQERAFNYRKSLESTNISIVKLYRNRADDAKLYRNLALGASIAVYVINILDAIFSNGKAKYIFIPDNISLIAYNEDSFINFGIRFRF